MTKDELVMHPDAQRVIKLMDVVLIQSAVIRRMAERLEGEAKAGEDAQPL